MSMLCLPQSEQTHSKAGSTTNCSLGDWVGKAQTGESRQSQKELGREHIVRRVLDFLKEK